MDAVGGTPGDQDIYEVPESDFLHWVFSSWYLDRLTDPLAIGVGYGSQPFIELDGIVWSRECYNPAQLPERGDWVLIELKQAPPGDLSPDSDSRVLIKEQLADDGSDRLVSALSRINRVQGIDFAEGLCLLAHTYLFTSDWIRVQKGRPSCLPEMFNPEPREPGKLADLLDLWDSVGDLFVEGFAPGRAGDRGMPTYRTVPGNYILIDQLENLYRHMFGDDTSRYPEIPVRVNLADIPHLIDGRSVANSFRHEGDTWRLTYERLATRFSDSLGLRYIAYLLQHPNGDVSAVDLESAISPEKRVGVPGQAPADGDSLHEDNLSIPMLGYADEVVDETFVYQLRERLRTLAQDRQEAESSNDHAQIRLIDDEVEFIDRQLKADLDLAGRPRLTADVVERARKAVSNCIRRALARIFEAGHHSLHQHLNYHIKIGTYCSYTHPDPPVWTF